MLELIASHPHGFAVVVVALAALVLAGWAWLHS